MEKTLVRCSSSIASLCEILTFLLPGNIEFELENLYRIDDQVRPTITGCSAAYTHLLMPPHPSAEGTERRYSAPSISDARTARQGPTDSG